MSFLLDGLPTGVFSVGLLLGFPDTLYMCRTHVKEKPVILLTILEFPTAKGLTLVSEVVPDTFADPTVLGWPDCRTDFPTPGTRQLGAAQLSENIPDTQDPTVGDGPTVGKISRR